MRSGVALTLVNLLARGAQFALFLAISMRHGTAAHVDAVFLAYAPIAALLAIASGISDTLLIPAVLRSGGGTARIVHRYAALRAVPLSALIALTIATWHAQRIGFAAATCLVAAAASGTTAHLAAGVLNGAGAVFRVAVSPLGGACAGFAVLLLGPIDAFGIAASLLAFEAGRRATLGVLPSSAHDAHARALGSGLVRNAALQVLSSLCSGLVPVIQLQLAQGLGPGAVSCMEYANRYWQIVPLLLSGPLLLRFRQMSSMATDAGLSTRFVHGTALALGGAAIATGSALALIAAPLLQAMYGDHLPMADIQRIGTLLTVQLPIAGVYATALVYVRALSAIGRVDIILAATLLSPLSTMLMGGWLVPSAGTVGLAVTIGIAHTLSLAAFAIATHAVLARRRAAETAR